MPLFSKFRTRPKVQNRSKRHFAKFLPFAGLCNFKPHLCRVHQRELAGFICESFAFQVPAPDFALAVFKGLSHVAPHAHILHLKNEDFTRDPKAVASFFPPVIIIDGARRING